MIRFENVTKYYGQNVVALREINLEIQKGEFVFLVGPSGSGKSSFLQFPKSSCVSLKKLYDRIDCNDFTLLPLTHYTLSWRCYHVL